RSIAIGPRTPPLTFDFVLFSRSFVLGSKALQILFARPPIFPRIRSSPSSRSPQSKSPGVAERSGVSFAATSEFPCSVDGVESKNSNRSRRNRLAGGQKRVQVPYISVGSKCNS
ncbi:unnamed protein product, partial [Rhizoctonia solani]